MHTQGPRLSFEHFKKSLERLFQEQLDLVDDAGTLYGPRWRKALENYTAFKQRHPEHAARISTREELVWLCASIYDESPARFEGLALQNVDAFVEAMDNEICNAIAETYEEEDAGGLSQAAIDYYSDLYHTEQRQLILEATRNAIGFDAITGELT